MGCADESPNSSNPDDSQLQQEQTGCNNRMTVITHIRYRESLQCDFYLSSAITS